MVTDTERHRQSPSHPRSHHKRLLNLVKHFQRSTKHFALTLNLACSSKFYSEISTNLRLFCSRGEIIAVHRHLIFSDCFLYMCQRQIFAEIIGKKVKPYNFIYMQVLTFSIRYKSACK